MLSMSREDREDVWRFFLDVRAVVNCEHLYAGPAQDDSYTDLRSDYQQNEPAVDYNSGFSGAQPDGLLLVHAPWMYGHCARQ